MTIDRTQRTPMRPSTVRASNAELVLSHLGDGSAATRAELAEQTSLTSQALGPILADLVQAGSVIEEVSQRSGPGRPPSTYRLDPLGVVTVEILIRFADFHVSISDALGNTIGAERARHKPGPTPRRLSKRIVAATHRLLSDSGVALRRASEVIITVEGTIDEDRRIVTVSPAWKATDVDLVALFHELFEATVPVRVISNERALAIRALELIDAPAADLVAIVQISHEAHLMLALGTSIISNRLGSSGLLTHYPMSGNDRVCSCGRTGCLGTVSSGSAVVQNYFELTGQRLEAAVDVIARIALHDPEAIEAARRSTAALASGLAGLLEVIQPDRLVLTGAVGAPGSRGAKQLVDTIRAELNGQLRAMPIDVVQPVIGALGVSMAQVLLT